MNPDIRWEQRFQNFDKALKHLEEAIKKENLSALEKASVIQIYEFTFELGWKTVKDYLEEMEVEVKFPKDTIKEGFKYGIIADGDLWMEIFRKETSWLIPTMK